MEDSVDYSSYFARERVELPRIFKDPEAATLESYLNGTITAQQCAIDITKYTDRSTTANSKIYTLHNLIFCIACDITESHDGLIDLLKEIRVIPESKETGGINWGDESGSFGELQRGIYDGLWSKTLAADRAGSSARSGPTDLSREWTRLNAFVAKLYSNNLSTDLVNGLKLLVDMLEKKKASQQLEMNLCAACAWLEHAGRDIVVTGAKASPMEWVWGEGSEQFPEKRGLDKQRLSFWKGKLESLSMSQDLSDEATEACERAALSLQQAFWEKK